MAEYCYLSFKVKQAVVFWIPGSLFDHCCDQIVSDFAFVNHAFEG
jgi:hypothetical protein